MATAELRLAAEAEQYDFRHKTFPISDEYDVDWHSKLGTGVSGPVRSCSRRSDGVKFALKCLPNSTKGRQEIRLHLKCSEHAHIVPARDVFVNNVRMRGDLTERSKLLVVMDYMRGGELFERIKRKKSFTEREARDVMRQVVDAVYHLHSLDIAHRDLKPENLLLRDNTEEIFIMLTDFGFAKHDDGTLQTPQFTPYYVAPDVLKAQKRQQERRRGGHPSPFMYNRSCDIWSLGVIMYILLCGYPPFYSESPTKNITTRMKSKIQAGQYEFPVREWGGISEAAKDLIRRCLNVDPNHRLTVMEMKRHPWLMEMGTVPTVELCSPALMQNEDALYEARAAHGAQLREMRVDVGGMRLKPMSMATGNKLLKKREAVKVMRDVLASLTLRRPEGQAVPFHVTLTETVRAGLLSISEPHGQFTSLLVAHGWNGTSFPLPVDAEEFAMQLTQLIHSTYNSDQLD